MKVLVTGAAGFIGGQLWHKLWQRIPETPRAWLEAAGQAALLLVVITYVVSSTYNPFIYFNF